MLNQIPGITAVKPKAAFYIFPKIDVKRFNIHSDEQFALDLLHDKHILISHGGAFNWHRPDHFRVVFRDMKEILCRWCRVVRRKRCIPAIARTAALWSALCQGEGDDEGRGGQCGCQEQIAHGG